MLDAIEMQQRRSGRDARRGSRARRIPVGARVLALLTATCMLLAGVCALRHETSVAHVRDALTGQTQHAHALAERHEHSTTPHLHGRDVDAHPERGECVLLAALDHSTILTSTLGTPAVAHGFSPARIAGGIAAHRVVAVLRLAPKTSPPARA